MFLCDIRKEFIFIVLHFLTIFPRIICYRECVIILNCCKKELMPWHQAHRGDFWESGEKEQRKEQRGDQRLVLGGKCSRNERERGTEWDGERDRERKGKAKMVFLVAIAENISSQEPQWLASTDVWILAEPFSL